MSEGLILPTFKITVTPPPPVSVLGKRKDVAPSPMIIVDPEKPVHTEKKFRSVEEERGWSHFVKEEILMFTEWVQPLTRLHESIGISMETLDTNYTLRIKGFGALTKPMDVRLIEDVRKRINAVYPVRQTTIDFVNKTIDIRMAQIKNYNGVSSRRTGNLSNVVHLEGTCAILNVSPLPAHFDPTDDPNDWDMMARLVTHAEHIDGKDTPLHLQFAIETPKGKTIDETGEYKTEIKRLDYQLKIKGYSRLGWGQLRTFRYLYPHHVHSLEICWSPQAQAPISKSANSLVPWSPSSADSVSSDRQKQSLSLLSSSVSSFERQASPVPSSSADASLPMRPSAFSNAAQVVLSVDPYFRPRAALTRVHEGDDCDLYAEVAL